MKILKNWFYIAGLSLISKVGAQVPVLINLGEDHPSQQVLLLSADEKSIIVNPNERRARATSKKLERSKVEDIIWLPIEDVEEAKSLFRGRKYREALSKFELTFKKYAKFKTVKYNPSTESYFYMMESARKMYDLEKMKSLYYKFNNKEMLTERQREQLELYVFWIALRDKNWSRIQNLAKTWKAKNLSTSDRAQVIYCEAHSLLADDKEAEARKLFSKVIMLDGGRSHMLVTKSVIDLLTITKKNVEVQKAIKNWGGESENPYGKGYIQLTQAAALIKIYRQLDIHVKLPSSLLKLEKFEKKKL